MNDTATYSKSNRMTQSQYVRQNQSCGSAFNCGAEYAALQAQVEQLAIKVERLECESKETHKYVQAATGLIKLQRFLLILLPLVELVVVGLVIYFFSNSNVVGYTIIGLIGLTTLINGFYLPNQMKNLEERLSRVESNKYDLLQ